MELRPVPFAGRLHLPDIAADGVQGGRQRLLLQPFKHEPELLPQVGIRAADVVCDLDAKHPHAGRFLGINHPRQTEIQQFDSRGCRLGKTVKQVQQVQQHAPAAGMRRSRDDRYQFVARLPERRDLRGRQVRQHPCGTIDEFRLLVEQQSVQLLYSVRSSCIHRYFAYFGGMGHLQETFSEGHANFIAHWGIYGIFAGGTGSMEQHAHRNGRLAADSLVAVPSGFRQPILFPFVGDPQPTI